MAGRAVSPERMLALALVVGTCEGIGCDDGGRASVAAPNEEAIPSCIDGKPAASYPPPPYAVELLGTLPERSFEGVTGAIRTANFFEPCARRSRLLVVRSAATWCGPCLWHVQHTSRLLED